MAEEPGGQNKPDSGKSTQGNTSGTDSQVVAGSSKDAVTKPEDDQKPAASVEEILRTLGLQNLSSEAIVGGKKQKEMDKYKFWQTQPVPSFAEGRTEIPPEQDGPIKQIDPAKVPQEPAPLPDGFEWVTMDLTNQAELDEVYKLLSDHYVEDDDHSFRFHYSPTFFNWALKAPGWQMKWHVGVRATKSKKLIAFVSGIPAIIRARSNRFRSAEVNFLCVHKKLRDKRLAPVLIKEITRRFYIEGIFQAIYTAGIVLPTPVSTCRYYHRTINFEKLYEAQFAFLPPGATVQRQKTRFHLPDNTFTAGLRPMEEKDIGLVKDLLIQYLDRFNLAQDFTKDEIDHWLLHTEGNGKPDQVVWTYVVESKGKVTDFFSFYRLESSVLKPNSSGHKFIKVAYLYYYATDVAFQDNQVLLKKRLLELQKDALILAKKNGFDVVNALTLLDNPLFLEELKFGPGDGQLHYYLYNYRTAPIPGGVDDKNKLDVKRMGGMGVVML